MTIFKFKVFYEMTDEEAQERFVVADSEESAWEKINAHFEKLYREGCMKPICIADPTVEINYAII